MKISKAIHLFWLDKKLSFSSRTVTTYNYAFKYLIDSTNDKEIEQISYSDILEYIDYLKNVKNQSSRTISDNVGRISSLWSWAKVELEIPHIFEKKKPEIAITSKVVVPFTEEEAKALLSATKSKVAIVNGKEQVRLNPNQLLDKALILVLLDSGARVSELCNWLVKDYDDKTGKLFIEHGKGDKQRIVVLGMKSQKALFKYLATRENLLPKQSLFATRQLTAFDKDNVRHKLERLGQIAKVDNVHPHRFRHTFAINFLRNGGNLLLLKSLLGHSTLEMVKHYARIAEIDIDSATKFSVADNWKL